MGWQQCGLIWELFRRVAVSALLALNGWGEMDTKVSISRAHGLGKIFLPH